MSGDVEHTAENGARLRDALLTLLREYTGGAYITLNENRGAMIRAGAMPGSSGGDVIRAGLGNWPESFLDTRRDLVDDVRASVIPPEVSAS